FSSWHCDPSQYATPSLHSSLTAQGPLTGFSAHPPFLQTRPFPQPLTCAVATQLAPTSPVGAQVPAVAPALANVKPLHTAPSSQLTVRHLAGQPPATSAVQTSAAHS